MTEHRLVIFPHAGGFSSQYIGLKRELEELGIDTHIATLHGREGKSSFGFRQSMSELVKDFINELPYIKDGGISFFGHSFGALVSYFLAKELKMSGFLPPRHIFLSAARAPNIGIEKLSKLDRELFKEKLFEYGGMSLELLQNGEFFDFVEPILRADFSIIEGVSGDTETPETINTQAVLFCANDDNSLKLDDFYSWERYFCHSERSILFEGGHFYIFKHQKEIAKRVADAMLTIRQK